MSLSDEMVASSQVRYGMNRIMQKYVILKGINFQQAEHHSYTMCYSYR